jgi:hypothetical protein
MARHQSGNGSAVAAQRPQRSRFVCFHEARISVDIGAQDGGQPPFHLARQKRGEPLDHRHRLRTIRAYEYRDAATLLADFWTTVDAVLRERGVMS